MKKDMLINVMQPEECRIAILENNVLEELYVERTSHESYVGNIYKGRIVNIEPSIQAAFVDFGVGRNGFLHVSDVEPAYYRHLEPQRAEGRSRRRSRNEGVSRPSAKVPAQQESPPPPEEEKEEAPIVAEEKATDPLIEEVENQTMSDTGESNAAANVSPSLFSPPELGVPSNISVVSEFVAEEAEWLDTENGDSPDESFEEDGPDETDTEEDSEAPEEFEGDQTAADDASADLAEQDVEDELPDDETRSEDLSAAADETVADLDVGETETTEAGQEGSLANHNRGALRPKKVKVFDRPHGNAAETGAGPEAAGTTVAAELMPPEETTESPYTSEATEAETEPAAEFDSPTDEGPAPERAIPMGSHERRTANESASSSTFPSYDAFTDESHDSSEASSSEDSDATGETIDVSLDDLTDEDLSFSQRKPDEPVEGKQESWGSAVDETGEAEEEISESPPEEVETTENEEETDARALQKRLMAEFSQESSGRRRRGGDRGGRGGDRSRRGRRDGRRGNNRTGMGRPKPLIQDIFKKGQEVLVQVIKEGLGTKGPTLSTYISIAGRYLVLMPGLNRIGVSRKISDEDQRRRLRDILSELKPPKGLGFIIRTAGLDRTKKELQRDLAYLSRLWQVVVRRIRKMKAPAEIYQESDMITRTIRDTFTSEIQTIWVDEPKAFEHAQEFLQIVMPRYANRIKCYDDSVPIFHKYGIENEISKIHQKNVPLPNGGSIVIEQTEALVAIDVNSGNFRADNNAEETAYQMNLLAAKEIARQLRLRDLGGVIVNDFIDMREEKHRRGVERALRDAVKRDRARTKILRISSFGIIEMTRQRIRPSLKRSVFEDCPHCRGSGHVKTCESISIDVMRMLQLATHRNSISEIFVRVHPEVSDYLLNRKRKELSDLETATGTQISIEGVLHRSPEHLEFHCLDNNGNELPFPPQEPPKARRR